MFVIPTKLLLGYVKVHPDYSIEKIRTNISKTKYRADAIKCVLDNCAGHGFLLNDFLGKRTMTLHCNKNRHKPKTIYIGALAHQYQRLQDFFIDNYKHIDWNGNFYMLNFDRFVCEFTMTESINKFLSDQKLKAFIWEE